MRTIQEIFNAVIDAGYYDMHPVQDQETGDVIVSDAMCLALSIAWKNKVISEGEYWEAKLEIRKYLVKRNEYTYCYLLSALIANKLPSDFNARLAIYNDWENRPALKHVHDLTNITAHKSKGNHYD